MSGPDRYRVGPLARALDVLSLLGMSDRAMTLSEISTALGLPKSSAYKYLRSLMSEGFAVQDWETDRYAVGPSVWQVRNESHRQFWLRTVAAEFLTELSVAAGETSVLAVVDPSDQSRAVILDSESGGSPLRVVADRGLVTPMHASAVGRAILAALPEHWRTRHLPYEWQPLDKLVVAARQGWALEHGEWVEHVTTIAAPVLGTDGLPVAALGVLAPTSRLHPPADATVGEQVAGAAARLTARIAGGRHIHPPQDSSIPDRTHRS